MSRQVMLGQYMPGESLLHRLDPRAKILVASLATAAVVSARAPWGIGALSAWLGLGVVLSGVPIRSVLANLRPLIWLMLLAVAVPSLGGRPGPAWQLGPLHLSGPGTTLGLLAACRLVLLVTFASLLTLTTSPTDLMDGLRRLLSPAERVGLPVDEAALMMSIALRFIPILMEQAEKIRDAQSARGAEWQSGGAWQRARGLVPLLVPLLVGAARRAEDLALAMEARCYRGGKRTRLKQLRWSPRDSAALLMAAFFLLLALEVG